MHVRGCPETYSRIRCHVLLRLLDNIQQLVYAEIILFFLMLCPICRVLMSDILIHLKGCAKTVPLHTTLPANPRYWLGADSKATPVGLCTTQSQVINHKSTERK